MKRRLVLVEDDEPVRASLQAVLASWNFQVDAYADGESFLAEDVGAAECVLLDLRLPGMGGMEVLAEFRRRGGSIPVIILTGHGDVAMAVRALQAGASDFIEKPFDDEDLVNRIEMARTATPAENPELQRYRARFSTLTPRETDVMRDVVAGHSNKIIAHRHGLSPKTIEIHRARVMEKTEAKNLSHLVRMALKAGIDPDSDGG